MHQIGLIIQARGNTKEDIIEAVKDLLNGYVENNCSYSHENGTCVEQDFVLDPPEYLL